MLNRKQVEGLQEGAPSGTLLEAMCQQLSEAMGLLDGLWRLADINRWDYDGQCLYREIRKLLVAWEADDATG